MSAPEPFVRQGGLLSSVTGTFFRSVDMQFQSAALDGSVRAGRYSREGQRTLYLSASEAAVDAAMIAHKTVDGRSKVILGFEVDADGIYDLREPDRLDRVRKEAGDPFGDWQHVIAEGGQPSSWVVRDWVEATGASGLIDPSRKSPGLWHLVLFSWNAGSAPTVTPITVGKR